VTLNPRDDPQTALANKSTINKKATATVLMAVTNDLRIIAFTVPGCSRSATNLRYGFGYLGDCKN
jgi:hypothetical protein